MDDLRLDSATVRRATRRLAACDECKRRKVRCSGGDTCASCIRDEKECTYSSPLHKLSAVQRRLQHAEQTIESMERAWARQLPTVSLKEAIQNLNTGGVAAPVRTESPDMLRHTARHVRTSSLNEQAETSPTEFSNAEDYEFDESQDFDNTTDGMGFLVAEPGKAGYMGPQSGVATLKFLQSLHLYVPMQNYSPTSIDEPEANNLLEISSTNISRYMDDYFSIYHTAYPILHEGTFRARVSGALAKPRDGSWPLLYNIVLAIGAFVGETKESNSDVPFYKQARNALSMDILEKGSLSYVQGIVLMANYLQKRNKPNSGFVLIGIGWSMALAIGLHREFGLPSSSPFTMEIRRRVWWTLFIFVSGAQLTLGRPPASLVGVNVRVPSNLHDQDLAVDMEKLPDVKDIPTVTSCLISQVNLANIANRVQVELLTNQIPSNEDAMALDHDISVWFKNLPTYFGDEVQERWFQIPKWVLIWRSFHLRVVLHRPILFKAITAKDAIDTTISPVYTCLVSAEECVQSICNFVESRIDHPRGLAWYATYWLITASFVQATCYIYDPVHALAPAWKQHLKRAVHCLSKLGAAHSMAFRARDVLQKLLDQSESATSLINPTSSTPQASQNAALDFWQSSVTGQLPLQYPAIPNQTDPGILFPWYAQGSSDAELLDATGGVMFQSYSDSTGPYFENGSWMPG